MFLRISISIITDTARCLQKNRHPSACVPLKLLNDIQASDVSSAELWFHKLGDRYDDHNQTFIISEVTHWDLNRSFEKMKTIAIKETDLSGKFSSLFRVNYMFFENIKTFS